jgi:hypothetical protein
MSAAMTAEFLTDALVMEIWRRGRPRELLHHSISNSLRVDQVDDRLRSKLDAAILRAGDLFQLLWLQVNALTHLTSAGRVASPETVSVWLCSY